jgi:hypothetical protein
LPSPGIDPVLHSKTSSQVAPKYSQELVLACRPAKPQITNFPVETSMRSRTCFSILALIVALQPGSAGASDAKPEPRTEAAVLAASDSWLAAELRGDAKALEQRLMPEYRDIEPNGNVHARSALIAHAANLKDPSTLPAKEVAAEFRKAHPSVEKVIISGPTALISYQAQETVLSVDVFVYDKGMWRALVSTHNAHAKDQPQ